ncbi:het-domain protein [Fusarium beomiforme]|uniref:Het-domain protein n=1 Tax=Fusarium beomiforme TaxID=44412 RepID=A0A9P5AW02_9HYPO|nr:het-domain protein [Fusarium beomiforme]
MAENIPYAYAPIKLNQIRLLKLVHHEASIAAVLKTFSLNEPLPPFHSLSYAWATDGTPLTKNWNILINKQELAVLDSLRPFFDALRSKGESLGGRWWWIDSICINQADLEERAQQVKHMQHIYCHADQVITWLGEESPDSNLAMTFIKHVDKISRKNYNIQELRTLLQTDEYRPHWTALSNLLSRRWWSRIWTVQEFVLPSSISFWCGNRNVSRVAVCRSISMADKCTSTGIKETPGFTYGNNRRRAWGLYKAMKKAGANVTLSLPALTAYFGSMKATDDRDRLYGLMGLSTDKPLLSVNYFLSTWEVYLRFAQAFIMRHKSLDIISFASIYDTPGDSSWPTWVPRWRTDNVLVIPLMVSQSPKTLIGNLRTPTALDVDPSISYSASGTIEATSQFEGSALLCQGVILDTVDGLAGSRHSQMVQSSTWNFKQTSCSDSSFSPTDTLVRTACSVPEELKDWFSWVMSLQIQGHSFESILRESLQAGVDTPGSTPNQDEYYHSTFFGRFFDTVIRMSMRLMVTRCGHIGMATGKAMKGDLFLLHHGIEPGKQGPSAWA